MKRRSNILKVILVLMIVCSLMGNTTAVLAAVTINNETNENTTQDESKENNNTTQVTNDNNVTQVENETDNNTTQVTDENNVTQVENQTDNNTTQVTNQKDENKKEILQGNLEVDTHFILPLANSKNNNIALTLSDEKGNKIDILFNEMKIESILSKKLGDNNVNVKIRKLDYQGMNIQDSNDAKVEYFGITFYDLYQGRYKVELTGDGYTPFSVDNIELKDYSKRVTISNEKSNFAVGDVNQDGIINNNDADLLIEHYGATSQQDINIYDLNRDGQIDIIDLSYIATNINTEATQPVEIVYTTAIVNTNNINISGDVQQGTNLEDLFDDGSTVCLEKDTIISEANPAVLEINLDKNIKTEQIRIEPSIISSQNAPTKIQVEVTDSNGKVETYIVQNNENSEIHKFTDQSIDGTLVIDLGKQVAVKKITIKVLDTKNQTNLAEIGKVEFLNNVYEEVPAPDMDIPTGLKAVAGSEMITVNWNHAKNITGYEVKIETRNENGDVTASNVFATTFNTYSIKKLNEKDILNYTDYYISVQSVNGEWKSGYSESTKVTPIPNRVPPAPENVNITGKYQRLDISWKKMKDTLSYNLYYRIKGSVSEYTKISEINGTNYSLENLAEETEYEIYLTGNNHLGEGNKSQIYTGKTIGMVAPDTHNYKLINTSNGENVPTSHIKDVTYPNQTLPEGFDKFDVVDNDYTSNWTLNRWDAGGYGANKLSPIVELDDYYTMNEITLIAGDDEPSYYEYMIFKYWDKDGKAHEFKNNEGATIRQKTSNNGKKYYQIKTDNPIQTNKVQVNLALYWPGAPNARVRIAEMKFYNYDSLEDDVKALFTDDLRIEIADSVTQSTIDELRQRANTQDEVSKEYHPNKDIILSDIELAEKILNDEKISDIITVDQNINNGRNSHLGFAMTLNDFQPLGITANAGEDIAVYVGTTGNVMPQLVFTQHYAESGRWTQTVTNLKKGQNIINVPELTNIDVEKGGSIYIKYPKAESTQNEIKVRVSGGRKIPVLDIHGITDENLVKEKITNYINELQEHVNNLELNYTSLGEVYNEKTSILNATELVTDNVILSIPASKAMKGISGGTIEEQTTRLTNSMKAFEELMELFYKEKGLSKNAEDSKDNYPGSRINIRYMRMFDGAFMYAGGMLIGVEGDSTVGLMRGTPKQLQPDGTYTATGYFGWGICHEIGHVIDEGNMIYGETSNNIFSLLGQTADDKQKSRLESSNKYPSIYTKVTSHTKGTSSDVFTTLGMFWQLHLAYDDGLTLTQTDTFYSRLNKEYRRTQEKCDRDNLLIRLASDAAKKDLTQYFEQWGLQANDETKAYIEAKGYEKEDKAIYYLNDEARRYRIAGGTAMDSNTKLSASLENIIDEKGNPTKDMKLTFDVDRDNDKILGYEIIRNGTSIGFTTENTYIDHLNALNNRVMDYEVIAYDKLLNKTNVYKLDSVKIEHDGTMNKSGFSITSNVKNEADESLEGNESNNAQKQLSINNLIDDDKTTIFNGNTKVSESNKEDAYIVIDLNNNMPVSGFKYTAGVNEQGQLLEGNLTKYKVYVSDNNQDWSLVKEGSINVTSEEPTQLIYFDKPGVTGEDQLYTAMCSYVKVVAVGSKTLSGAELDLIAPPGDNIDLQESNIGILENDFKYAEGEDNVIKAGSVIFKGDYRGNPAFNACLLIDGDGNTIDVEEIFMATLPENSTLGDVAKGAWIAYMSQEDYSKISSKVKVNMYRVNDAITLEGQRLVSDTKYITLKGVNQLPNIELKSDTQE